MHPSAIVYPNVELGEGSTVEPYCILGSLSGEPLTIGEGAVIRAFTRIYGGPRIGSGLRTGHHALIRGDIEIGDDFHIGSYSSVEGTVWIGDRVKIQGRCEVADSFVHDEARIWVGTYVCDNNDPPLGVKEPPVIRERAKLYAGVIVMPGATIGEGAVVAAGARAKGDIPDGALFTASGRVIEGAAA